MAPLIDHVLERYRPPQISGSPVADVVAELLERLGFLREHPWLVESVDARPVLSRQRIRLIELGLARLSGHPADGPAKLEALTVVADMLHTQARHESDNRALDPAIVRAQMDLLYAAASDGAHPHLAEALGGQGGHPDETPDEQFARVLTSTLQGLLPADT